MMSFRHIKIRVLFSGRRIGNGRELAPQILSRFWIFVVLILILTANSTGAQQKNSCVECHTKIEGKIGDPARTIKDDVHLSRGLSCNDCHGGDPTQDDKVAAKDPSKGYLGRPRTVDIPAFCGKCHNDANFTRRG